ncbi:GNAT family N-acetyltransferase [Quadrisphaera sp. DSM 44207]|uniref:aminotransferase class I/II-fold pyridoxal phosphate-dependent enzyme n=1 Tax=Quadrisphaera sp. DSM 44207 TaxID=1881057 RepID=UPI0008800D63|nr:GNAT family N-acetyltransferase [Quadrisphaera sp. DSM 44207]SDQ87826.1 7-keto-8-aminopelargonate synthetase [Quadrisphaera sp. DSM 44207]
MDAEDLQRAVDEAITHGVRRGHLHAVAEDDVLDGRTITLQGRRLVNFGSCSYLGLETHPAMRAGVVDAVVRYGTQFSSSRAYVSAPPYARVEEELSQLLRRPAFVAPSTTLGHLATLPTVVGPRDALLLDHQVHTSVQSAATHVRAQGSAVELVPHNDLEVLERRVVELSRRARRVWYAADGLYSMYADFAPLAGLDELLARHPQLWLYLDDAHGFSWTGSQGRGHVLEHAAPATLERAVVAGSLNKSFAAAGGAFSFPDAETRRRVSTVGGPMIFSGPVQPPMLGALLASFALHRGPEVAERQRHLLRLVRQFNALADEAGLPLVSDSEAPIRCIGAGDPAVAHALVARLRAAGAFADTAVFPAVSAKRSGARLTLTAHHTPDDVTAVVEALAQALPAALAEGGSSLAVVHQRFARQLRRGRAAPAEVPAAVPVQRRPGLRLERADSVDRLDPAEWDALLGGRGAFDVAALRVLEAVFARGGDDAPPEDRWDFSYWIVRDDARGGAPVAATFFTTALWKDDMLSSAALSAEVERLRAERGDPYFLTSRVLATGSLLTEGEHLWLDRSADWRGALRVLLDAARAEEDRAGASALVLRDLPDGDEELHELLVGEGFARVPVGRAWTRHLDFDGDDGFLASLRKKARQHVRARVLPWEARYRVDVLAGGPGAAPAPAPAEVDHLHDLYRRVHARGLDLNVFPLPRRTLDAVLASPGWEVVTLSLREGGPGRPVAFCATQVGAEHVQPLFLGLDYDYVADHHAYQQVLWQALRSGQRHGAARVLYGLSAGLHKARFGAVPEERWAYVQATDTYNSDVLARLAQTVAAAPR